MVLYVYVRNSCKWLTHTLATAISHWSLIANTNNESLIANGVCWNSSSMSYVYIRNSWLTPIANGVCQKVITESNSQCTVTSIYTVNTRQVKSYQYGCSCVLGQLELRHDLSAPSLSLQVRDLWELTSNPLRLLATLDSCEGQLSD